MASRSNNPWKWRTLRELEAQRSAWSKDVKAVEDLPPNDPTFLVESLVRFSPDNLLAFPTEIRQMIVESMPLIDRVNFARTSKGNRALCATVFRLCLGDLFRPYGISLNVIRLMLMATGTGLSGSAIPWLAIYPRHCADAFTPGDLDFYVPRSKWRQVLLFLRLASGYTAVKILPSLYGPLPAVRTIFWLKTHVDDPYTINLMQCADDNVFGPPTQFHSTCVVGWITANSAWFPYLNLTSRRISVLNRGYFNLESLNDKRRALAVLRKYQSRGFKFAVDYEKQHTCGSDFNCPCTARSDNDDGVTTVLLPALEVGIHYQREPRPMTWSFRGLGCNINNKARPYDSRDIVWEFTAQMLIDFPAGVDIN
ncbi:hypothetical protein B0H12DRAFT_1240186 [Mycena haematopus]|nr:hypothetical protein B0H12DRAFT_1240186 [Mycena haematopus]